MSRNSDMILIPVYIFMHLITINCDELHCINQHTPKSGDIIQAYWSLVKLGATVPTLCVCQHHLPFNIAII